MGYKGSWSRVKDYDAVEATYKRLEESKRKKQKEEEENNCQITSCLDADSYEDDLES